MKITEPQKLSTSFTKRWEKYRALYLTRERRELIYSIILLILFWGAAGYLEIFELIYELTRRYEDYEVDEFFAILLVLPIVGGIFTFRRMLDLRREMFANVTYEHRMERMALYDSLTGMANRLQLQERLEMEITRAGQDSHPIAVLMIDLDRFKNVNDTMGHHVGDELLRQVSERIGTIVRKVDLAARFGGDEFVVVQTSEKQPDGASTLASRIISKLATPFIIKGQEISISCSIGISINNSSKSTPADLLRASDIALYRAKNSGRNRFTFFEVEMELEVLNKRQDEQDLRAALRDGQLGLVYQPIVRLGQPPQLVGYEALLRWHHPRRGLVSPAEFVPLAEECGLIREIGLWVITTACTKASTWPEHLSIAVNVSPSQIKTEGSITEIIRSIRSTGVSPHRVHIEITEDVLIDDPESAMGFLSLLREEGIAVVMDDFGTGYSSLGYLRRFPFDKVKIDRSFVIGTINNKEDRAIVKAISYIGQAMNLPTIGEGVESMEHLLFLMDSKCTEAQGFLLGRPMTEPDHSINYQEFLHPMTTDSK